MAVSASADSVLPPPLPARIGPQVVLVVRGQAPVGSDVSLDSLVVPVDSAGRYLAYLPTDSLRRATGTYDLCLLQAGQKLCTTVRPQGFDTVDLAPLQVKIDTIVETHDTIRTMVDTTRFDSAALLDDRGPKVVQSSAGGTVVIRGKRRPPKILGQEKVTVQTIRRQPGLAEPDVMRAVQALPGVVQSSDFSTKVYVRGSSSDQNLVLFDNAVVYSPAHAGGLFSTFLSDAVGGLDFYKSGFEPRYGDRMASVLSVTSKNGGWSADSSRYMDTWIQGAVRVTSASGSAEIEGHHGEFSWVGAGRHTWIGYMLDAARWLDLTDVPLDYGFYDMQGSASWGRGPDSVRVSFYGGRDSLYVDPLGVGWGNFVVPINTRFRVRDGLTLLSTFSRSEFSQNAQLGDNFNFQNSIGTWSTRQELQWELGKSHLATTGYEFSSYDVRFLQERLTTGAQTLDTAYSSSHAVWVQDRWNLGQVTLTGGLRAQDYTAKDEWTFDPRLTAFWSPNQDWQLTGHFGIYHQPITSLRLMDAEMPTEFWFPVMGSMKIPQASITSVGFERGNWTDRKLRFGADVYYKQSTDLPLYYNRQSAAAQAADTAAQSRIAETFTTAKGWAMGLELHLAKESGWWTASASYSLAWSAIHQDPYTNSFGTYEFDPYWANWDQRSTFKLGGEILWRGAPDKAIWKATRPGNYFRSSFALNYNSGHPYTGSWDYYSVSVPTYEYESPYVQPSVHNGLSYPNYFRMDLTPVDVGRVGAWRFYWSILNVTNHQNVLLINYDNKTTPPQEKRSYQFPFLPIFLGYEREF